MQRIVHTAPEAQPTYRSATPLDALLYVEGLTGAWLARTMETSEGTISRWRRGLPPSERKQKQIARVLSKQLGRTVTIEELWP